MLNIIKSKLKNSYKSLKLNVKHRNIWPNKYVPIVRDWKNSIYSFNKNSLNNIFEANKLINKLITGYFNLYNLKYEKKIRLNKNFSKKKHFISKNKILISLGQFKHTNDLINITIYFYNRQLITYMNVLKKKYLKLYVIRNSIILKKLYIIKKRSLKIFNRESALKSILLRILNDKDKVNKVRLNLYKIYIKKSLIKDFNCLYLNLLIFINKSKFNNYYLHNLTNLIKKIYKKNIQFNFINLKYHYLNSDIFTKILLLKLSVKKRRLLASMSRSVKKAKILEKINELENINVLSDSEYLKSIVLDNVKYKKISGVRLEVKGRLTKRFTASRSISKLKYKGNLINIQSSKNFESSALIRGNIRPNLEYTKLNSVTRVGAYGIKGWISGK
uniref:Small ribosomal subunit protein uS3m n=1 Tax=Arthroderma uncinatum TaxID=74035 RepID=C5HA46_9EURO|nr:ribosomal protein S5 [Arthroderma uncinatum]ACR19605.1 ribosomal protein S5 [Arthroderma uncinatum]